MSLGHGLSSLIPKKSGNVPNTPSPEEKDFKRDDFNSLTRSAQPFAREISNRFQQTPPQKEFKRAGSDKVRSESVFQIETDKILPNPYQPRREFKDEELRELAQSIREFGVIQPLIVTKLVKETERGAEVEYQLIVGERRLKAARLAGLPRVPAIVRQINEDQLKLEVALIENLQRSNLSPLETARAYVQLQEKFGMTQREIAQRIGKSREVIANSVRLLSLPREIQIAMSEGRVSESQARMLLAVPDIEMQAKLFDELLRKGTTVRELKDKIATEKDPKHDYWEKRLEEKLGAPVKLVKQGTGGRMIVQFYSDEEWQSILGKLLGEEEF